MSLDKERQKNTLRFRCVFYFQEEKNYLFRKQKRASTPGGEMDALIQREWEKCSRSNKRGVCLVCDLFHILIFIMK